MGKNIMLCCAGGREEGGGGTGGGGVPGGQRDAASLREPPLHHSSRPAIASRRTLRIVDDYSAWLATTQHLPKLYLHAEPGFFAPINDAHSSTWPNVTRHCVKDLHFCQEDDADTIGQHIARFVDDVHKSGGVPRSKL